jgi:copper chaperone
MNTQLEVENLKCNGCANTIKKELAAMKGVLSIEVDTETALVKVSHEDTVSLESIKGKLTSLGYPEINTLHGIPKIAANAKSYVSCAIGRLS